MSYMVPPTGALPQISNAAHEDDKEGQEACPSQSNVEVEDPLHIAHSALLRSIEEDKAEGSYHQHETKYDRQMGSLRAFLFHHLISYIEASLFLKHISKNQYRYRQENDIEGEEHAKAG